MDFNWISSSAFQNILLFLTLIFAISIGYKQNQINENILTSSLKPIVLRGGTIEKWSDLKSGLNKDEPLLFSVMENAAFDINGFVVLDGNKYRLLFSLSKIDGERVVSIGGGYRQYTGWIKKDGYVLAVLDLENLEVTDLDNGILVNYRDSQGNEYRLTEDSSFKQEIFKK